MIFTAAFISMTLLRGSNAMTPNYAVYWTAPEGSWFTNFSATVIVPHGYNASDDTVSVVAGLTAPDSVELFMSYLSANASSNGWHAHEAAVYYDHHHKAPSHIYHDISSVGGNISIPAGSQITSKFGFEGTTSYGRTVPYGLNHYQVNLSFVPLVVGPGRVAMDTSKGMYFTQVALGIMTEGNVTWDWSVTQWTNVTISAATNDTSWCELYQVEGTNSSKVLSESPTSDGSSSACFINLVELTKP